MVGIQKQKSPEQARVTSHASYAGVGLVRLVRPLSRRSDSEAAPVVIGFVRLVRLVRLNFVSAAPLPQFRADTPALKIRPTTSPFATTSKSSSFHWHGRAARFRSIPR